MANIIDGGKGINVKLIGSMERESFVDIAATITRSEKSLDEIVSMDYNEDLVKKVVSMSHLATTEFDYFVFAVEGASRVCETQLVRKRIGAAYMIKTGRIEKGGKRSFDVIKPPSLDGLYVSVKLNPSKILINDHENLGRMIGFDALTEIDLTYGDVMDILEQFYNGGVDKGYPEEDMRFAKPQGTEFKCLIAMTGHALLDWFKIRCCNNAQWEIKILADKKLALCKSHSPALFSNAGASCKVLGYCPENGRQCEQCKGRIMTHEEVKVLIKEHMKPKFELNSECFLEYTCPGDEHKLILTGQDGPTIYARCPECNKWWAIDDRDGSIILHKDRYTF